MNEPFVDLRREDLSSESFWPSFTDIMMVVVIIFLLTSMLLMVRNWELLDQLRNSMAAEQQAEKRIQDTSQEKATLEEQLAQAQNEISMLRMQLMQASEQNYQLNVDLENKDKQVVLVLSENEQLKNTRHKNEQQIAGLKTQLTTLEENLSQLNIDIEQKEKSLEDKQRRIIILTQERDSESRKLANLEEDFGSLKIKYDKLIRPARTARGKHVVSVNYERVRGKARIRIRDNSDDNYAVVTEKQLHKHLDKLKKQYPNKLYIKIVIPKHSGLTYNEAWQFMKRLLNEYDYYYQENNYQEGK